MEIGALIEVDIFSKNSTQILKANMRKIQFRNIYSYFRQDLILFDEKARLVIKYYKLLKFIFKILMSFNNFEKNAKKFFINFSKIYFILLESYISIVNSK